MSANDRAEPTRCVVAKFLAQMTGRLGHEHVAEETGHGL